MIKWRNLSRKNWKKVLKDVQIVKYQAELVKIEGKYYWTAFVECEKQINLIKILEK